MTTTVNELILHQRALLACRKCPEMIGPVVTGKTVNSKVLLIGQAPGIKEGTFGKPFAWTAGKTLFKWFEQLAISEEHFRDRVYMAAVCRCFPGKNPRGGDRVPSNMEIEQCKPWLQTELRLLEPQLVIPIGKLAIAQLLPVTKLKDVVGKTHRVTLEGVETDIVPLPHPSGASTWHRMEPGKTLLGQALDLIRIHPAWQTVCRPEPEKPRTDSME